MSGQFVSAVLWLRHPACVAALLYSGFPLRAEEAGSNWTWRNPLPQGNSFHDLTKAGNHYLACGRAGTILGSLDGVNWTPRASGTGEWLRRLAADGSTVVAVGRGGTITSSLDGGQTWTVRASGTTADFGHLIRVGPRWVAFEGSTFTPASVSSVYSTDGVTWIPTNGMIPFMISGVAWSGSRLVAVGNEVVQSPEGFPSQQERIAHSGDGISWTMASQGIAAGALTDVVWTGTQFIVAASGSRNGVSLLYTVSLTSPDGLTWTRREGVSPDPLQRLLWTGSLAVSAGYSYSQGFLLRTSPDGIVWTPSVYPPLTGWFDRLFSDGPRVLGVGGLGMIGESTDHGLTWANRSSGVFDNLNAAIRAGNGWIVAGAEGVLLSSDTGAAWTRRGSGFTGTLRGLANANGTWLATGRVQEGVNSVPGVVLRSTNGIDWQAVPSAPDTRLYSVIRAGEQWVAGGSRAVQTSPDGLIWTRRDLPGLREVRGVATDGSRLVVVGGDDSNNPNYEALIYFSDDGGVTWTAARPPGSGTMLFGVTWTGSQFVAVGRDNLIFTSPTGSAGSWTARTAAGPSFTFLRAVAGDHRRLVIAGSDGIQTSTDNGITWTYSQVPTQETLYCVVKTGGGWAACGYDGTLLTSPDALQWTARETGTDHELYALVATPGGLWVAGEGGTLLSSVADPTDSDQDGLTDFLEGYFGTSPAMPNRAPFTVQHSGSSFLLLWPEASPAGKTITPQWSPDLITWLASGEAAPGIPARSLNLTSPSPGQKTVTLDRTGLPSAHLRLKVTQP